MSRTAAQLPLTEEAYLRLEAESTIKHEYVDGAIYARSGAGERHNRMALNAAPITYAQRRVAAPVPCSSPI